MRRARSCCCALTASGVEARDRAFPSGVPRNTGLSGEENIQAIASRGCLTMPRLTTIPGSSISRSTASLTKPTVVNGHRRRLSRSSAVDADQTASRGCGKSPPPEAVYPIRTISKTSRWGLDPAICRPSLRPGFLTSAAGKEPPASR